ncbi:MAG: hypothetical protein Q9M39_04855 [Sulfurovum sp.]|nr:hypothetical protein [Sulfurovum sp.]
MKKTHDELPTELDDPLMAFLNQSIKVAVKLLAILMVLVIFWSVAEGANLKTLNPSISLAKRLSNHINMSN